MTTTKHASYTAASATILTTQWNSLANNANTVASSTINNTTNLDLYMDLTFLLNTQTARTGSPTVKIYGLMSVDGTNFDDLNESCALLLATFTFDTAVTARRVSVLNIDIPPASFQLFGRNTTSQTMAASGNILSYRTHSLSTA